MGNFNILQGQGILASQTIGEFLNDTIGETGSTLISTLLAAAAGIGMIVFLIIGSWTFAKMGQESNIQQKEAKKKKAINAFLIAGALAIAAGSIATIFLAIPFDFGDTANTVFDYTPTPLTLI